MTFRSDKTCQHLRAEILGKGAEERMRVVQALSHGYSTGSKEAIAQMLLASLSGVQSDTADVDISALSPIAVGHVADAMQASANDPEFNLEAGLKGV